MNLAIHINARRLPEVFFQQMLRKVRFTLILLLVASIQVSAKDGFAQITLSENNSPFLAVIKKIQVQSGYDFVSTYETIKEAGNVTVRVRNVSLEKALEECLKEKPLTYTIIGKTVVIKTQRVTLETKEVAMNISDFLPPPIEIRGRVTDENGNPLAGVSVTLKGSNTVGTTTNEDGIYLLTVGDSDGTLVFSYLETGQEVAIGNRNVIDVILIGETVALNEVAVTALGITREKRKLNYSLQQIDGDIVGATGNVDISRGLQGKIAGLTVRQTSGAPGKTPKVTIRGSNSITGSNDPLYVVNGSPVDANIALNISPDEIESVSVLKGAAASALYGLRASNGVILMETKTGKFNRINIPLVTFANSYSFENLAVNPHLQELYGQGVNGVFDPYSAYSFGPKISEWGTYINQLGESEEAKAYDNVRAFFKTGGTVNSHLSVSNKFDRGNYSIGGDYSDQEGIVPKTNFKRLGASIGGDYKITDKLGISTTVNYSNYTINSFREEGGSGSLFYAAYGAPPSYDLKHKPTHVEGNPYQQINFRGQHDNIYWVLDNSGDWTNRSSVIGSVGLQYNPESWLNLSYRIGLDEATEVFKGGYGFGSGATAGRTNPPSGGRVEESEDFKRSINSVFLAMTKHSLGDKFTLDLLAGNEFYDFNYRSLKATGDGFTIPDLKHLSNADVVTVSQYLGRRRSYAFFGNANIDYAKILSLTLTARNDVVSNMPRNNRSFFYPSVGLGFTFSELLDSYGALTFGKVRANYAEVGQAGAIYNTSTVYQRASASRFAFPYQGINAFSRSNSLKSSELQPENTKAWELGANLIFFKNRINLDYSYYNSRSVGQIFSVPVSASTGFTAETRNAGEMANYGHEVVLTIKPILKTNFSWDITTNFSAYTNKVIKLADGVDELTLGGTASVAYVVAREGEHFPVLRGYGYSRDNNGKIVVSSAPGIYYGMPLRSPSDNIIFGKSDPDFELNALNAVQYKNISLFVQIDWRQGGIIGSTDWRLQKLYGTHYDTQFREEDHIIPNAMKGHYDNSGELIIDGVNDIAIKRGYDYWRLMDGFGEQNVYDATFIRLREVRINYDIPTKFLKNRSFKSISVYLIGRNLWLIKSGVPFYDPEMNASTGNDVGFSGTAYPQVRDIGFGISLKF